METKRQLSADIQKMEDAISRYFTGGLMDIEFISQMAEPKKLLEGLEMEDLDEVTYWSDALTEGLMSFANNRKVFTDIRFTTSAGKSISKVIYAKGQATSSVDEAYTIPDGYKAALESWHPVATWSKTQERLTLWLHYPVGKKPASGIISAQMDLQRLFSICKDEEVYLVGFVEGQELAIISAGSPAPLSKATFLADISIVNSSGSGISDKEIFAFRRFQPIKWMTDNLFTIM